MKIQLIDINENMIKCWHDQFDDCENVVIHQGDIFSLSTDCIVSPANSFGFMDGGLDYIISQKFGWGLQKELQSSIKNTPLGEILVGDTAFITTSNKDIPYLISAPTMRLPMIIKDTVNVYLAAKGIFTVLQKNNHLIKTVTISGLGTGAGGLDPSVCAKQMREAYNFVYLMEREFPKSWREALMEHNYLINK